jgi:hypothetical protein
LILLGLLPRHLSKIHITLGNINIKMLLLVHCKYCNARPDACVTLRLQHMSESKSNQRGKVPKTDLFNGRLC